MNFYIFFVVCCVKYLTAQENSILQKLAIPAIIGGQDAKPHQWPWQIALNTYGSFSCSGSLISDRWVITAAHCLYNQLRRPIRNTQLVVRLGIHLLSSTEPEEITANVTDYAIHPEFQYVLSSRGLLFANDIAVLQLAEPVNIAKNSIRPIHLPSPAEKVPNGSVYITGWGYIYKDTFPKINQYNINSFGIITVETIVKVQPDALQQLQTMVANENECFNFTLGQQNVICIGDITGGNGPCEGDSGGPLVARNNKKRWTLYGVLSYGPNDCGRPAISGVYTEVSAYVRWIRDTIDGKR